MGTSFTIRSGNIRSGSIRSPYRSESLAASPANQAQLERAHIDRAQIDRAQVDPVKVDPGAHLTKTMANKMTGQVPLVTGACELAQLNFEYLQLLSVESMWPQEARHHWRGIDSSPEVARRAMADCLFSLFTLELNDRRRWLGLLAGDPKAATQPFAQTAGSAVKTEFAATAVIFAWHLAHRDPFAAKVLLDVDTEVASAFRDVSVSRLRVVAAASSSWLAPRWPQNPHFWPALVQYAGDPAGSGLRAAKLLGRQLLAAETLALQSPAAVARPGLALVRKSGKNGQCRRAIDVIAQ